jgi:hypothetical protein
VKGAEADMWEAEKMQDNTQPLIINVGNNSPSIDDSADNDHYMEGIVTLH